MLSDSKAGRKGLASGKTGVECAVALDPIAPSEQKLGWEVLAPCTYLGGIPVQRKVTLVQQYPTGTLIGFGRDEDDRGLYWRSESPVDIVPGVIALADAWEIERIETTYRHPETKVVTELKKPRVFFKFEGKDKITFVPPTMPTVVITDEAQAYIDRYKETAAARKAVAEVSDESGLA